MEEIGAYLLRAFYDDDVRLYRDASAPNHVSLRALASRCGTIELPVSASFLSTSIRLAAVSRSLPASACFGKLPVSHRVELLRLPHDEIEETAKSALVGRLSVRGLRREVRRRMSTQKAARGRPRTPLLVRVSRELVRALGDGHDITPGAGDLSALTGSQRAELERALDQADAYVRQLRQILRHT